jgi:hypothetical protein
MEPLQVTVTLTPTSAGFSLNVSSSHAIEPLAMIQVFADAIKAVASSQQKASPQSVIEVAQRMPPSRLANGVH